MQPDRIPNVIVEVGAARFGNALPLTLIAGPCALESRAHALEMATALPKWPSASASASSTKPPTTRRTAPRLTARAASVWTGHCASSPKSATLGVPVLTDVHDAEAMRGGRRSGRRPADSGLPLPADRSPGRRRRRPGVSSTSRRASSSRPGTWPMWSPRSPRAENRNVLVTERGVSFGYNTLVSRHASTADHRAHHRRARVLDATHSVQQPGGQGTSSGGQREFVPVLARAAVAVGVAAVFIETHRIPTRRPPTAPTWCRCGTWKPCCAGSWHSTA